MGRDMERKTQHKKKIHWKRQVDTVTRERAKIHLQTQENGRRDTDVETGIHNK